MSLRIKFFIVLALLGVTLALNVGLSIWGLRFLERELAWPLRSAQPVLQGLHRIKRLGEQQASDLGIGRFSTGGGIDARFDVSTALKIAPRVVETEQQVLLELQQMDKLESLRLRSGVSTTENVRSRSHEIMELSESWVTQQSQDAFESLIAQIEARHELIERIEGRIIEDAALANDYGRKLRMLVYWIIGVAIFGAVLVSIFSVTLLRRWILQPIAQLRVGAQYFARGEFDHEIEVQTGDELGQLGNEFNHMASMIQTMQDERVASERLAAMGEMAQRTVHNLRTPLAGIRALAETTLSELHTDSDLYELQQRIVSTVDRFEGWLQGMLRVSSPLSLHHRTYDPQEIVQRVIDSHKDAAKSRSVELVRSINTKPSEAIGDPDQLEHAVTAILSNAIDYAPQGSRVELLVGVESEYWTLEIRDRGPGIPAELHTSIFRPYFTTRKSGTGIGLALVKRIAEQHLGSIEVRSPWISDSEPGTMFLMRIALNAQAERKR